MSNGRARNRLEIRRKLPGLSAQALHVVQLALDPDTDLAATAAAVGMNPQLSANILRIANSPLYATQRRADNLRKALMLIGLNATLSLALCFAFAQMFRPMRSISPARQAIWQRSVLATTVCKALARMLGWRDGEQCMLAGLVQDLGQLVLAQEFPGIYPALLERGLAHEDLPALETELIGCSHIEVGAWMAQAWNLPDFVEEAIRHSHAEAPTEPLQRAVALSGLVADLWITPSPQEARVRAETAAARLFDLGAPKFLHLLEAVEEAIPEMSSLFDMGPLVTQSILPPRAVAGADEPRHVNEVGVASRARHDAERRRTRISARPPREHADLPTGVFHRRYIDSVLEVEYRSARAYAWDFSVIVLRLDNHAVIDARHGQAAADEAMRRVAQLLVQKLRDDDVVGRLRADAFVVLLPGTARRFAGLVRDRLLAACSAADVLESDHGIIRAVVSAGIASADAMAPEDGPGELMLAAERERESGAN
ncbi:MAG TPA: HDOD domain-containing protein [Dokdonella sp.]|nr:HDOD domain-containing protein [Dokdonella sp.]